MTYKRKEVIGDATLYLGDCLEILPTLPKVDSIVCDPPYGMGFQSNHRNLRHMGICGDADNSSLLWACNLQPEHSLYAFCRWDNLREVPAPKSCITWVKNNWSMGDLQHEHARQTECILFYAGKAHKWPRQRPTDAILAPRTGNEDHPTQKPVYLMEAIVGWTAGTVADPFMGSGTTGVSCANLGRKFIGIEIEEKYFNVACERIDNAYRQQRMFP